ncbi:MAG: hypothetical protein HYZ92_03970 [Candidatus Omnitrophica bacterium]|nr:hypothetical protein [Candidatus Omnitrophota bacterium]
MADRPAACTSCGKRLSKKSWYYRNGQFFCKKRCWMSAKDKAASETTKAEQPATPA